MSEIINSEIKIAKDEIKKFTGESISDDRAFSHVLLKYVFEVDYIDQLDLVTDGPNDGGIDFLYFDDEEGKVILCQSKYTNKLTYQDVIDEFSKAYSTYQNFQKSHTGSYNSKLKVALQNVIDRLSEDNADNVELDLFTTANLDIDGALKKTKNTNHEFPSDAISINTVEEIETFIQRAKESLLTVKAEKIQIDKANNYLEYESDDLDGIVCNVLSKSIVNLYNKYSTQGLFDLNIRKYIRNRLVDEGIQKSLDSNRENFWFLNNGLIIACTDYEVDGNTIKLYDFSIVNGGQTTYMIGNYKGTNTKEFYIPCKIVATKDDSKASYFYTKIAEATNSQKPIYPRDLKSNSPEMVNLQRWLKNEKIHLEIKRGDSAKKTKAGTKYSIKNDELGQIILSFAHQMPGTSRSGKKKIFDIPAIYDKIFKINYQKDNDKKQFILDLIELNDRYLQIEKKLKQPGVLIPDQLSVLKNGKQTIFALMGVCYRLANNDIKTMDINVNPKIVQNVPMVYGTILSNYSKDDLDSKLERLIKTILRILTDSYQKAFSNGTTTSVSNFMKTDSKYCTEIVRDFNSSLDMLVGDEIKYSMDIFKR